MPSLQRSDAAIAISIIAILVSSTLTVYNIQSTTPINPFWQIYINDSTGNYEAKAPNGTICFTSTLCETTFTSAVAASPVGGEIAFAPSATYNLSASALAIARSNITVSGGGWNTKIQTSTPDISLLSVTGNSSVYVIGVTIKNLAFISTQPLSNTTAHVTNFQYVKDTTIENCLLEGGQGSTICAYRTDNFQAIKNTINRAGFNVNDTGPAHGIEVVGNNSKIKGNTIKSARLDGILFGTLADWGAIAGNHVEGNTIEYSYADNGIYFTDNDGLGVEFNTVIGNTVYGLHNVGAIIGPDKGVGIKFYPSSNTALTHDNTISNNVVYDCQNGIGLTGYRNSLTGNTISNMTLAASFGVYMVGGVGNIVSKNIISNVKDGVYLDTGSTNNQIAENSFYKPTRTAIIQNGGAGTVNVATGNIGEFLSGTDKITIWSGVLTSDNNWGATIKYGSASLSNGDTFAHGLPGTPTSITFQGGNPYHDYKLNSWNATDVKITITLATQVKTGSYVGDGSTGTNITTVGFQPRTVVIFTHQTGDFGAEPYAPQWRLDQGGACYYVDDVGQLTSHTNMITALISNGFTVSDVGGDNAPNKNGVTYDYIAWGGGSDTYSTVDESVYYIVCYAPPNYTS